MTFMLRDSKDESKLYLTEASSSIEAKEKVKKQTGVDTYYIGIIMPQEVLTVSTTGDPIISM